MKKRLALYVADVNTPEKCCPIYSGLYKSIIQYIDVDTVEPMSHHQLGKETLKAFTTSILKNGFLRPIFISPERCIDDGNKRFAAAKDLGLKAVPCVFVPTPLVFEDDLLISTLKTEPMHFLKFAAILSTLTEKYLYSQESIAFALGRSQSFVANKLRLLQLSQEERAIITETSLTERHCRALLKIKDLSVRAAALRHVSESSLTVSAAEYYISNLVDSREPGDFQRFVSDLKQLISNYSTALNITCNFTSTEDRSFSCTITTSR